MLQEHLMSAIPNTRLEKFQQIMDKAHGGPQSKNARVMLEQAKGELEGTELKILMLMLQMRGQFDRSGAPMLSKSS